MGPSALGVLFALTCFTVWSLYPLVWAGLQACGAQPYEILAHRVVWAQAWGLLALFAGGARARGGAAFWPRHKGIWAWCALSGALNVGNWLICIWAVTRGHMVEASFGYLMAPLLAAAVGVVAFREHLKPAQWLALAIAAVTVVASCSLGGPFPWVALAAGLTASGYVAVRKQVMVHALAGLVVETAFFVPAALFYLLAIQREQGGVFPKSYVTVALCILAGLMTALAIVLYASATHRLRLTTLGIMQYIYPAAQLMLGIFFFHEAFTRASALMLGGIVAALVIYSTSGLRRGSEQGHELRSRT